MLRLVNLDDRTRELMLEELELDVSSGTVHIDRRLSDTGRSAYMDLLREAVREHDDAWLADQLDRDGRLNATEERQLPSGRTIEVAVPWTAAEVLAEREFNRLYARA